MKTNQAKILTALVSLVGLVLALAVLGPAFLARDASGSHGEVGPGHGLSTNLTDGSQDAVRGAQSTAHASGFFSAPVGRELTFEITGRSSAKVEMKVEDHIVDESVAHRVDGRCLVRIAARREDEIVALYSFPTTSIEAATGATSRHDVPLEEAAAIPCQVRMGDDGRLLGFRFDPAVAPAARNWIRSQIAAFHFEVEAGDPRHWERTEQDPTGSARVTYVRESESGDDDLRLRKTKIDYAVAKVGAQGAAMDVQPEITSDTTGTLSRALGWVRTARFDERLSVPVTALGVTTDVVQQGALKLVADGWCAAGTLPEIDWSGKWASVSGAEDVEAMSANGDELLRSRLLEGVTLDGLLAEIDALVTATPRDTAALMDARHLLAELLLAKPEAIATLAQLVPSMSPAAADVVLGAVGAAGSEPAQRLLNGVLDDARLPASMRQSSLDAMFQLKSPISDSYAAVERIVADPAANPGLRSNGLLVFGALASMDPASEADRNAQVQKLIGLEGQARDQQNLEHWLHALGNTGSDQVLPAARPYLQNADPRLRAAAADALRGSPEATGALSQRALSDADARVRSTCAAVLADRSDAGARKAVSQILQNEPAVEVRRAAVDALARHAGKDAEARALLEYVAHNDPSQDLRARAAAVH